ncbi:bifunctional folylpolyglutamate synthase/dihydrofolate synthase [Mesoplasma photuris]|uniref:bifunctional folylpolyglutamate synthase/dihydrofolate synthase n=1 Tax=Mesoplasma photuris TaxID=217731 RepID=UPI0004E1E9D5|nr:Mur ligase family protein [Mesoplasma photuris]
MISVNEYLFDMSQSFKEKYNLKDVLSKIGNLQNKIPVINVVGTNGKGSTSHYLSLGLKSKYNKVGLFISPAFQYHNERIQINNVPIGDQDLLRIVKHIEDNFAQFNLTFFEMWVLIAVIYFNENKIDIAVIEAGIGGIKDMTNLFNNQLLTLVTSVSLDHVELLGPNIEDIIYQKVNIAKPNTQVIISADNFKYKSIFKEKIINRVNMLFLENEQNDDYQINNKQLVKSALEFLKIDIDESLFNLDPPLGRYSKIKNVIIDGAHNVDAIKKLITKVKKEEQKVKILYASIVSKDYNEILKLLDENFSEVYITNFENYKSWNIDNIKHENKIYNWKEFLDQNKDNKILVCGSLYFIPEVYKYLKK